MTLSPLLWMFFLDGYDCSRSWRFPLWPVVVLQLQRPFFVPCVNVTSCDPVQLVGSLSTTRRQLNSLASDFTVIICDLLKQSQKHGQSHKNVGGIIDIIDLSILSKLRPTRSTVSQGLMSCVSWLIAEHWRPHKLKGRAKLSKAYEIMLHLTLPIPYPCYGEPLSLAIRNFIKFHQVT